MEQHLAEYVLCLSEKLNADKFMENQVILEVVKFYQEHSSLEELESHFGTPAELASKINGKCKTSKNRLNNALKGVAAFLCSVFLLCTGCAATAHILLDILIYPGENLKHGPASVFLNGEGFSVSYQLGSARGWALAFAACLAVSLLVYVFLAFLEKRRRNRA